MTKMQPAFGSAILWGDGMVQGNSVVSSQNTILGFGTKVGVNGVLSLTFSKWFTNFVDPNSITNTQSAESILAFGEDGTPGQLVVGPPGSWFYPNH